VILSSVQSLVSRQLQKHFRPAASTFILMTILTLTTGSAFIMWLGEQINRARRRQRHVAADFRGIVVGLPRGVADLYDKIKTNAWGAFTPVAIVMLLAVMVVVVAFIRVCRTQ